MATKPRQSVIRQSLIILWGLILAACFVLTWVFVVFLSSTFFTSNNVIFSATSFTTAATLSLLVVCALLLGTRTQAALIKHSFALFIIGGFILLLVSLATIHPIFSNGAPSQAPVLGSIIGIGLAPMAVSLLVRLSRIEFVGVVVWYLSVLTVSIGLFLIVMLLTPHEHFQLIKCALPLFSCMSALVDKRISINTQNEFSKYARSLAHSQMSEPFKRGGFAGFSIISGFLFGYCYNIYPKSTRFAGVYSDAVFGSVSTAVVVFLVVCLSATALMVLVSKTIHQNGTFAMACLLTVALALVYFALPYMPYSWVLFVLLENAAIAAVLFVLVGSIMFFSLYAKKAYLRSLLLLLGGIVLGAFVAMIFIEATVPNPSILLPQYMRDVLIVGTPSVGFIALIIALFIMERHAFFHLPIGNGTPSTLSSSGLSATCKQLGKRYSLTPREEEILILLLQGRSGPYVADNLYLSKGTVKTHIRHIYGKVGVKSRQQLIDIAELIK